MTGHVRFFADLTRRYVTDLSSGIQREAVKADFERAVAELVLPRGVHPLVARAFNRAVRLQLYSWFEPDFSEVAELEALRALEFYLRERYRTLLGEPKRPGLAWLLSEAVKLGWIRDSPELRAARFARLAGLDFLESLGVDWLEEDAFEKTIRWLGTYRNELAHGSQIHSPGGFVALRIVRQIIVSVSSPGRTATR